MMTYILHLIDDLDFGGAQQVVMDIACSMKYKSFVPLVCSLSQGPLVEILRQRGIETIVIEKKRSYDFSFVLKLLRIIHQKKIKLIHTHLLISHIYGWIAAKLSRIPIVMTVHGVSLTNLKHGKRVFRFVARRSDSVVVVSEDLKKSIEGKISINGAYLKTVYNGVDLTKFSDQSDSYSLKRELQLSPQDLVVGSIGTLRPVKGYEYLLKAASLVQKVVPEVKFVIVGDGPIKHDLEIVIDDLGLKNNVFLLGYRQDVPRILPEFDLFVLSSLTEGISISILEAMAASKPIVATNVGGNPEIVENGITGILVPDRNPEKLAEAITQLLKSEKKRKDLGAAGRKRIEERFSLEAMVKNYEETYDHLLDRRIN